MLIHYSTDYVFDGTRTTPYDEAAPPNPVNVYGESKLAGERAIAASGAASITLRTSWVYGRYGQNFLMTMQKLATTRREMRIVADQWGVPNWSRSIARATIRLLSIGLARLRAHDGLYHLSARGATTWYGFAQAILREDRQVSVTPITTAQYPTPACRPAYGVLDATRFARTFGFALPDWQTLLQSCLAENPEPPIAQQVH